MLRQTVCSVACIGVISGCGILPDEQSMPEAQYQGTIPTKTQTPTDAALECLARAPDVRSSNVTLAVHVINDTTGKMGGDDTGAVLPSDVAGMLVTSLQKTGVRQVNRVNTAVTEWELSRAQEQTLGDGRTVQIGDEEVTFRPIERGVLRGSDYVIDGNLTQLDFNTFSSGGEAFIGGIGGGGRIFALTTAADLRVTNTQTTEIRIAESYSKQAVGREIFASIFRFFGSEDFDIKIGEKQLEGLHAGVRWMMADAAYDIVSNLTNHSGACDRLLPDASQQVRDSS